MPIRGAATTVVVTTSAPESPPANQAHGATDFIEASVGTGTRKARHRTSRSSMPAVNETNAAVIGLPSEVRRLMLAPVWMGRDAPARKPRKIHQFMGGN